MIFQNLLDRSWEIQPTFQGFWFLDLNPHSGQRKRRFLEKPNTSMRALHKELIRYLREQPIPLPSSKSCRPHQSPLKNVEIHARNLHFFLLDLKDAYGHVDANMLTHVLCEIDPNINESALSVFLHHNCLSAHSKGLATGAPASPDLFNIYTEVVMDRRLREIAGKYHLTYTRYLDDLTFSSRWPIGKEKRREIRRVISEARFEVNHKKSKVYDLRKGPIEINGIGLACGGRLFLPRRLTRSLAGLVHRAHNDRTISPNIVHGKMGGFISITRSGVVLNATEKKLLIAYQKYQHHLRTQRSA